MKFAHILSRLTSEPWFITPDALAAITSLLEARLARGVLMEAAGDMPAVEDPCEPELPDVAIVRVHGVLGQHLSLMEKICGGVDYADIVERVAGAVADPAVSSIVLHINSRGGMAIGCGECYGQLMRLRASTAKPIIAFVDGICCSAAMYIAAASSAIICTESAMLGSIGTILTVEDHTEKNAKEGIKRFAIKSASMKDIGSPDRPMTAEEKSILQQRVDFLGGMFVRDFTAGRSAVGAVVSPEVFATALTWFGQQAVDRGLADEVVPSLPDFLARFTVSGPAASAS